MLKGIIEEAGLTEEVDLDVRDGAVVIAGTERQRKGWADEAKKMHVLDDDRLLDPSTLPALMKGNGRSDRREDTPGGRLPREPRPDSGSGA